MKTKFTYYFKSAYYLDKYINKLFDPNIWYRIKDNQLNYYIKNNIIIDYVYLDGKYAYHSKYYSLKNNVRNIINDNSRYKIGLKNKSITNLNKIPELSKYIFKQYEFDLLNYYKNETKINTLLDKLFINNNVYIFKAVNERAGRGNQVITSKTQFITFTKDIIKQHSFSWNEQKQTKTADTQPFRIWVLQEFLKDPLLINYKNNDKYKFHIRHYLFYNPNNNNSFFYKYGEIIPAIKPYVNGDYTNKDIHDTHLAGRSDLNLIYPNALNITKKQIEKINKQIKQLYSGLIKILNNSNDTNCFTESKKCYHVFGIDLFITNDYNIKLIEVNHNIGLTIMNNSINRNFRLNLLNLQLNFIVYPLLNYKPKITKAFNNFKKDIIYITNNNKTIFKTNKKTQLNKNKTKKKHK